MLVSDSLSDDQVEEHVVIDRIERNGHYVTLHFSARGLRAIRTSSVEPEPQELTLDIFEEELSYFLRLRRWYKRKTVLVYISDEQTDSVSLGEPERHPLFIHDVIDGAWDIVRAIYRLGNLIVTAIPLALFDMLMKDWNERDEQDG